MEWYHDHTLGSTRLNVYAGMASAYLVTDTVEAGLVSSGALPPASRTIPLVLQDRTFVPDDIALQDAHWNTTAWGQPGDSWFPHVYETVQDPNQANNWNSVGRWHYGPWFWPVFPALYNLPEGTYSPAGQENTVTTTPEGWNDTAIVNGVAYPTLTVDPTTYRFRVLNASNDRMMTFNLFEATATGTLSDGTPSPNVDNKDANGNPLKTELNMVPAAAPLAADACLPGVRRPVALSGGKFCTPETWPTDGRIGGVPNPAGVGPTIYQIANESGWLPAVATYEPTPINYIQDKGRIVVLNVDLGNSGLLIAPAERADVVIDFSQYAGKTLLVYNDSGAPVPAGDPRNDLFTGVGDQTGEGGAEDTKPGFGPNTRTMMQIVVKAANAGAAAVAADPTAVPPVLGSPAIPAVVPTAPIDPTVLNTAIRTAYFSDQTRRPVVAQDVYSGFDASWAGMAPKDMYGDIYLGSLKNPTFQFTPGTPSTGLASISMTNMGAGYTVAPEVSIAKPAGGVAATGLATMKIDKIAVTNKGKGYTSAPVMSFSQGGGNGALANAFLAVDPTSVTFTPGKYGTFTGSLQVTFTAAPGATVNAPAGVTATGTATVVNGAVTGIVITNPGSGYTSIPLVNIVAKDLAGNAVASTVKATAKVTGVVDSIILYGTDNTTPTMSALTSGGGGYTDLTPGTFNVNIRGGLPLDPATGLALAPAVNAVGVATGKVFDITLTNPGSGYAAGATPVVTLTQKIGGVITVPTTKAVAAAKAAATPGAKASYLVKTKTIQELFDPTYGRLNATLGIELPFTSAMTQTTIPLGYVDETTEQFAEGETQIWKITHNGVDSHPVHFHLLDVQVINRVGWDGFIQPIEPKEMGWKETVMMSPLEDIIVAVRAKKPVLPGFGVPESNRLMDPTQPEGSPFGFTQIDPATGNPAIVTNAWKNYGWEYVWHCHILGHEENDFMRPVRFDAKEIMPPSFAPTVTASVTDTTATINFVDNSTSEIKYSVRRAPVNLAGNVVLPYVEIGTELALTAPTLGSSYVDTGLSLNSMYSYQVAAIGGFIDPATATNAEAASTVKVSTYVVPTAATNVTATPDSATQVTLNWTAGAPVTSYSIVRTASVGGAKKTFTAVAGAVSLVDNTAAGGTAYSYVVTAVNGDKTTASSPATVTTPAIPLVAPSNLTAGVSSTTNRGVTTYSIRLNWTDNTSTETGFAIWRQTDGATAVQIGTVLANVATFNNSATNSVLSGHTYAYYVTAINTTPVQVSPVSNTVAVKVAVPEAPTGLTATPGANRSGRVVLNWTAPVDGAVTSSQIQYATNSGFTGSRNVAVNGGGTAGTVTGLTRGTTYYFRVVATNGLGAGAASAVVTAVAP
jgi:FtsP/CotA-like multicopper oxidase with cupredoxin domain